MGASGPDRNIGAACQSQNRPRVPRRFGKIDIAGQRTDAEKRDFVTSAGVEQPERVVDSSVDIDENRKSGIWHGGSRNFPRVIRRFAIFDQTGLSREMTALVLEETATFRAAAWLVRQTRDAALHSSGSAIA
jgi:hypothetical protein